MQSRLSVLIVLIAAFLALPAHAAPHWTTAQAENLARWIERAEHEAMELPAGSAEAIRAAIDGGDQNRLDAIAGQGALTILRAWRGQCCGIGRSAWWHIDPAIAEQDLRTGLEQALLADHLDFYLRSIRPTHPYYARLSDAYALEDDPLRRAVLARNLQRWRWLPANLGDRYLLVNIAAQELSLWDSGRETGRWRVIVGKPQTRTPVFETQVSGLVLNPWWEIPSSIAAEGIASFVRRSPAAARARGYIYQNGRYRQMPGDNNALGRMKLVMPNPYSVFLHDTSNRELFAEPQRAFSHGCVRVDQALQFASMLLARDGWTQDEVMAVVDSSDTRTIMLEDRVPLFVAYFTAEPRDDGSMRFFPDIYNRDNLPALLRSNAAATGVYGSPLLSSSTNLLPASGDAICPI